MMYRLFTAFVLPAGLVSRISCELERGGEEGLRPGAGAHVTLNFLGDVDEGLCGKLVEGYRGIKFEVFEVALEGCGFFGGRGRSVFHLRLGRCPELVKLKDAADGVASALGLRQERREYVPHLTLARYRKEPAGVRRDKLEGIGMSLRGLSFRVGYFSLYSSELSPAGAVHRELSRFHAAGTADCASARENIQDSI